MSGLLGKSAEERKAIRAKGAETYRRRAEQRRAAREHAETRKLHLLDEIEALERKIDALSSHVGRGRAAERIDGNFLLTSQQVVDCSFPLSNYRGVYFLIRKGRVMYVGQSVNVFSRISAHAQERVFDRMAWLPCGAHEIDKLEATYIHLFRPDWNGDTGRGGSKTAPIPMRKIFSALDAAVLES